MTDPTPETIAAQAEEIEGEIRERETETALLGEKIHLISRDTTLGERRETACGLRGIAAERTSQVINSTTCDACMAAWMRRSR